MNAIKKMEWNERLNLLCGFGLVITFILTTWWMTLCLWIFQWAVWMAWVAYERKHHPKEIEAFFRHNMEKHFPTKV